MEVIRAFPDNARQRTGYEIHRVQMGAEPTNWKPFISVGAGVREIRVNVGRQYRPSRRKPIKQKFLTLILPNNDYLI